MNIENIIFFTVDTLRQYGYVYDIETYKHSLRVMKKVNLITKTVYSDIDYLSISLGAFLHDLGKTIVPKEILYKPGKLTEEEFEVIKSHPRDGVNILNITSLIDKIEKNFSVKLDKNLIEGIIEYHHEKGNGQGYYGTYNTNPIIRIVSISDIFCALTEPRCYKKVFSKECAINIIKKDMNFSNNEITSLY